MESNNNKKIISISSTTNNTKEKKDSQISKTLISNQFCIKMFDYMIF